MPQSALHRLAYTNVNYPLEFELTDLCSSKITHCGVLEFTSEEGFVYIPTWMMEVMKIEEYDTINLKNVSLMKAEHTKLQPHIQDFLELSDPKAVLETSLRNFSCLTTGATNMIEHNKKKLYIDILETKPSPAVCMIDTDCEVDFAPPLDYKEPEKRMKKVFEPSKVPVKPILEEEEKFKAVIPSTISDKTSRLVQKEELLAVEGKSMYSEGPKQGKAAGKLVFGSRFQKEKAEASVKEEIKQEETVRSSEKFQSFTGKSYRLTR
ncbi:ubiquitin recognition factor in ER-associated degradation protein 1-like [Mangifera indica]|uniref:ubiquitin recognition factor in ER-associated degradation protein 1-like n=1 Tax=Mangifera indica TaxID=29780 RepID=UPI001CFAFE7B|nr:ubiquitin recognition factor in ER-associated degradation protein 1-like [Mangifera indica]